MRRRGLVGGGGRPLKGKWRAAKATRAAWFVKAQPVLDDLKVWAALLSHKVLWNCREALVAGGAAVTSANPRRPTTCLAVRQINPHPIIFTPP